MWITILIIAYLYAGFVVYLAALEDINQEYGYDPKKKTGILLFCMVLWPILPFFISVRG